MTVFIRAIEFADKAERLRCAVLNCASTDVAKFSGIPGSPLCYWANEDSVRTFIRFQKLESTGRHSRQGLATADDARFLRVWTEVIDPGWRGLSKGGAHSQFYFDFNLVINWTDGGSVLKAKAEMEHGSYSKRVYNEHLYFRPGLTWPRRTNGLSFRALPSGCIFGDKGPAAFIDSDSPDALLALCAVMNSAPFGYLVSVQLARTELAQSYEVGIIQQTPVPDLNPAATEHLSCLARSAWTAKRTLDTANETSHAFILPAALRSRAGEYDPAALQTTLTRLQADIDDAAFGLYGLDGDARTEIEAWATRTQKGGPAPGSSDDDADDEAEGEDVGAEDRDALASWAVGVAFGRFDVRLATGERTAPPEPEPFEALPKRSAGMTPEDHPARAVLVDDPGHPLDLMAAVTAVLDQVELTLGAVPSPLRPWLAKNFFPLHIRMYSKSRRKAPIYWQLATPSCSYSVWLYLHALGADTLYRLHEDVLAPKVAFEQRRLDTLHADAGPNPTSAARKDIEDQASFVDELQTLAHEVAAVAPLWRPNLDDGVLINFAPLWRAVPQNRAWQKELLATWKSLNAGDYDWSHLAMHLWPERVVPKCQSDRSLAIAHGLESVFWEPETDAPKARWRPRLSPTRPTEDLIAERSSPAIKTALSHLDATRAAPAKPSRRRTGRGA